MRRVAVLAAVVSVIMGLSPRAVALDIPFDAHQTLGGVTVPIPGQSQDTGMIGVCDNAGLNCTGIRVSESTSSGRVWTTPTTLTLRGNICIGETTAPCSSTGGVFTGVRIRERVVDTPEVYGTRLGLRVNICYWVLAPEWSPTWCLTNLPISTDEDWSTPESGNLADKVPDDLGLEFSG